MQEAGWAAVRAAAIALCALIAEAQPGVVPAKYKTGGNTAGGEVSWYGPGSTAYATIAPVELEGKLAYLVSWSWHTWTGGDRSQYVSGLAPSTCVKPKGPNGISVDLDLNLLLTVTEAVETDCTTGTCVTSRPLSVPFKGFFEPFTGALSTLSQTVGKNRTVRVDWHTTYVWTGSGEEVYQTANFTGTIGPIAVAPFRWDGNASMNQRSGSGTTEVLPTPPQ